MAMAKTAYSLQVSGESYVRAKANELPISPKHAIEIAKFIRDKNVDVAIDYLHEVVALKKAIPFKHFNRKVAHKRGLDRWDAGRYPQKASKAFIRLLESLKKNAEYSGVDVEKLQLIHVTANRGFAHKGVFPRAMGRASPKRKELVNLEIIAQEVS
jgi:large subunit ribosomal protein L22